MVIAWFEAARNERMTEPTPQRIIVAITGATGTIFGIRALQLLGEAQVETYLILSKWGARTLLHETSYGIEQVESMASRVCAPNDQGAPISSGSFPTSGMLIAPCSVRTLAAIANGMGDNLVHRAADVVIKERRKLVLAVREAPLSEVHLENMSKLARMGVVIAPPVPAFYHHPRTIEEIVDQTVMRLLDPFGIHLDVAPRWDGVLGTGGESRP
jgi:4-hydroxy-3-polyprenylbenzoate decarboxylase